MKNILLIGGSRGIGLSIAKRLQEVNKVFVASRSQGALDVSKITHLQFDVLNDTISDLELPDQIDGLVFCPGTINLKPFKMLKPSDFEEDLQLNFIALVKTVHGLLPQLKKSEQASLVFFSTVAVKIGMPFHTSVAASKGAIEGFTKALAAEYAPALRVNCIAPSLTDTPLAENLLNNDKKKERMNDRHPLKRVGTSEDIAAVAEFLLGNNSTWITGQILGVDGGMGTLNTH